MYLATRLFLTARLGFGTRLTTQRRFGARLATRLGFDTCLATRRHFGERLATRTGFCFVFTGGRRQAIGPHLKRTVGLGAKQGRGAPLPGHEIHFK
jgi:hypothetical protein